MNRSYLQLAAIFCFMLAASSASAGEWSDYFLGKKGLGSQSCPLAGCTCCDDYCPKPLVCPKEICGRHCDNYCPKPQPCIGSPKGCQGDCYSPKCFPPIGSLGCKPGNKCGSLR